MTNPLLKTDVYKIGHMLLYPAGTQYVYETLTPRKNSFFPWSDKMTAFGYTLFVAKLQQDFEQNFFSQPRDVVVTEAIDAVADVLGNEVAEQVRPHFEALHDLGYLPLKIKALPEGTLVPMQVPVLTIENTHPDFYWLPGYMETLLLSETFVTSTVASMSREFRRHAQIWADKTADDNGYIDYQFHDFSERGQHGNDSAILSGIAHLTSFNGTDVLQAPAEIRRHFPGLAPQGSIGGSVLATEHSVMEAYGEDQFYAYRELVNNHSEGILSIVSDTYDYWEVVNDVLPALHDDIMRRNGKTVIRPDSDGVDVTLTDDTVVLVAFDDNTYGWAPYAIAQDYTPVVMPSGRLLTKAGFAVNPEVAPNELAGSTAEQLVGTLESMWATFGGTVNTKGYRVLDSHIGLLHGEGVTLDNVDEIFEALEQAGFSAENIVLGVGAYVYSVLVSRDSFGQALKATDVVIDGVEKAVFKNPKSATESFKKSRKGRVIVKKVDGTLTVEDGYTLETENTVDNEMRDIFVDGELFNRVSFEDVRAMIR